MPVPQVEEPERFPGGVDALCDRLGYGEIITLPLGVDLPTYPAGQPSGDEFPPRRRHPHQSGDRGLTCDDPVSRPRCPLLHR